MARGDAHSTLAATRRSLGQKGPLRLHKGHLWIEALPYDDLVSGSGTPILVYSSARLRDNIRQALAAADASGYPTRIHFALKACYLIGVVTLMKEAGLGVEVMSGFEYALARKIGFTPDQIVVNGPAKRPEFLERAVRDGVALINVESLTEIASLETLGRRLGKPVRVGVRINPLPSRHLRGPFAPPGSKFGFDVPTGEAAAAVKRIARSRSLSLQAVHCHSYTRRYSPDAHRAHVALAVTFVKRVEAHLGIRIPALDLGGGFGSRSLIEAGGHTLHSFMGRMLQPLAGLAGERQILIEPGRYLVNDAAVCLTRILSSKLNGGRRWVLVDAGRNLLPPRKNAEYAVVPCEVRPGRRQYHVGDFLCMPSEPVPLSFVSGPIEPGDLLGVFNAGAYTFSMAQRFGEPIPSAILVDKADWTWLHRQRSVEEELESLGGVVGQGIRGTGS